MSSDLAFFALVIGINSYDNYSHLKSAVRDADKFEGFLLNTLRVPQSNIISLRDKEATRSNIIDAFQRLMHYPNIRKDNSIVIYYAGHGARAKKPEEWRDWPTYGPDIEILCPSDIGVVIEGKRIAGIPDRTIAHMLYQMSSVKGDNITLILDCCNSAGMNRGRLSQIEDGAIIRQISDPPPLFAEDDKDVCITSSQSRGPKTPSPVLSSHHQASHVLLAACGTAEYAVETPRTGGVFTYALLRLLENADDIEQLTYTSLMHLLEMPSVQTPHCYGRNVHRRLFTSRGSGADPSLILGVYNDDGSIILKAGEAQGISIGSLFGIHASIFEPGPENPQLGVLVVESVEPFISTLTATGGDVFDIPNIFYAKKLKDGPQTTFSVHFSDQDLLRQLSALQNDADTFELSIAEEMDSADFCVNQEHGVITFDRRDPFISSYIGTRFPSRLNESEYERVPDILQCMANFCQRLRTNCDNTFGVSVELMELAYDMDGGFEAWKPVGNNLIRSDNGSHADVAVDRCYGLAIINEGNIPLYANVFYFDPTELSITPWYMHAMGTIQDNALLVDPSILPYSALTLGYGDSGTSPWTFMLRPGEDVDVGFLRIYLSTVPADFSPLIQRSPFDDAVGFRRWVADTEYPKEQWCCKTVLVVQREEC